MSGRRSNGSGVLVDTVYYRYRGLELENGTLAVDGIDPDDVQVQIDDEKPPAPEPRPGTVVEKIVPVEIRLQKEFDTTESGSQRPVKSLRFSMSCENPKFAVAGSDIDALRLAVWDHLDKAFAVKWESYLLVTIRPASIYFGRGTGFEVCRNHVDKGTAHDGTLLLREYRYGSRGFEIKPWPGAFKDKDGKLTACIPATRENEKALDEFEAMINSLRDRLADFFRPEQIQQTLANLCNLKMLGSS